MKLGEQAKIKPKAGIQLRKENGQILAADGETVTVTSYWLRRFKDGDIEAVSDAPAAASAEQPTTKTKG